MDGGSFSVSFAWSSSLFLGFFVFLATTWVPRSALSLTIAIA